MISTGQQSPKMKLEIFAASFPSFLSAMFFFFFFHFFF